MTIKDFLASYRSFNNYKGSFGIEIETETLKAYDPPQFYFWKTEGDGSLRNFGIEYILKQPIHFADVKEALKEFEEKTNKISFIKDSFSTSVHLHVNMLNETATTMGNFITLYFLFENLLIRYSGPNRRSNLFCLPVVDAEETFHWARSFFEGIQLKNYRKLVLSENSAKYAALNLSALGKYGSLEIRSFRGETDTKIINEWVGIINSILEYSRKKINPKEIMEKFKTNGMKFRDEVFGDYAKSLTFEDDQALVEQNVFYAGSIAYSVKNWSLLDKKNVGKFAPTKKQIEHYSIGIFGKKFEDLNGGEQQHVLATMEKDHLTGKLVTSSSRSKDKDNPLVHAWQQIVNEPGQIVNPAAEVEVNNIWLNEAA